jgi:hypothetical protein
MNKNPPFAHKVVVLALYFKIEDGRLSAIRDLRNTKCNAIANALQHVTRRQFTGRLPPLALDPERVFGSGQYAVNQFVCRVDLDSQKWLRIPTEQSPDGTGHQPLQAVAPCPDPVPDRNILDSFGGRFRTTSRRQSTGYGLGSSKHRSDRATHWPEAEWRLLMAYAPNLHWFGHSRYAPPHGAGTARVLKAGYPRIPTRVK